MPACSALALLVLALALPGIGTAQALNPHRPLTMAQVIADSHAEDWRALDPHNTLFVQLPAGRVVIELAPGFAPRHVANVQSLARQGFFDGLPLYRVQDDFVVEWGDPDRKRAFGRAHPTLPAEFTVPSKDVPFTALPDPDTYAATVGFADGFPAARDPKTGREWLVNCYGTVGVGRGNDVDSGNGSELYVVIGHAPRQLDRNATLIGRVVQGMELLSSLPRGHGDLGFYDSAQQPVKLRSVRVAADVPARERTELEVMRTESHAFADLVESRRNRRDAWYKVPAGRIDVCNVPIPVRPRGR